MDRESADDQISDSTRVEPTQLILPQGPVIVSVCTTCKTADDGTLVGSDMFAAVRAAFGKDHPSVVVRPVQCLSVCKRPATVAVSSPNGYTFLFGDLQSDSGTAALVSFVKS
jgi:predicted metal-binding protein